MTVALIFWSQPQVFTDSWVELASTITLIAFVLGAYRHLECHKAGCHRLGRFPHGRYKLCHVHHPDVPSDGRITQDHIDSAPASAAGAVPAAGATSEPASPPGAGSG